MPEFRDLFAIIDSTVVSAIFITFSPLIETPFRAAIGFTMVLFAPEHVFGSALFSGRNELHLIGCLALSIVLNICIIVFIGPGLNYTPCGIGPEPISSSISTFTSIYSQIRTYILCNKIIYLMKPELERKLIECTIYIGKISDTASGYHLCLIKIKESISAIAGRHATDEKINTPGNCICYIGE